MILVQLRQEYHRQVCEQIIRATWSDKFKEKCPNFTDVTNRSSIDIGWGIVRSLGCPAEGASVPGQTAGTRFERLTREFLEEAFKLLHHLRPGQWEYSTERRISDFDQYEHLAALAGIIQRDKRLSSSLGTDYVITPDILVGRWPVSDAEINASTEILGPEEPIAGLTPLRRTNLPIPHALLHASISCKWTIRSDRAQNIRTEALNLVRNRKGPLPHIAVVTAEPLPTRIASIALGTGDLDCAYHFALPEMQAAIGEIDNQDQRDMLETLVQGRRLRDISDLPFDLAT